MYDKILCPVDGSDHAHKALELAIDMAGGYGAGLVIIHVPHRFDNADALRQFAEMEGLSHEAGSELSHQRSPVSRIDAGVDADGDGGFDRERLQIETGQRLVDAASERAHRAGLTSVETRLPVGDPADQILDCIKQDGVDCVVMGARGLSDLQGLFLGSVSHKVASRAPCTCISVR
jgi:nucleotide-binding universal stress UspA family protein